MRPSISIAALLVCTGLQSPLAFAEPAPPASPANLDVRVQDLLAKVKNTLRVLNGGTFEMGDWGTESGQPYDIDAHSRPVHNVTLDSFSMMAFKVTYDDFDVFTDASGGERIDMNPTNMSSREPKRPAGVSWFGAKSYCQWLGSLTKLPFDLPTEAQWEYAARSGGKKMLFATDNGRIERPRNFPREWEYGEKKPPLPDVGTFPPNPAGLYGMSENTSEWVNDWFAEDYYKTSAGSNPRGPDTGSMKVMRGSVGGRAEIAAMVFMRTKASPQPLRPTFPNGITSDEVMVPFPGQSGYSDVNFRCVVNAVQRLN